MNTLRYWLKGIRFYIAVGSLIVTVLTIWWAQTAYGGGQLATIRTQEIFAWLATLLLTMAISIGPTYKLFPHLVGRKLLFDARRLVGISAAWFAVLHAGTAYIVQFGTVNPLHLPANFRTAFAIGAVALLILLAMALTSFDKAFRSMGIWWFRLHRLVYVAALLVLVHIFIIGVHATQAGVFIVLGVVSLLLLFSNVVIALKYRKTSSWRLIDMASVAIVLGLTLHYGLNQQHRYETTSKLRAEARP
jgi:sulfoxide reductase heme-binding subunit YedZ